MARRQYAGAAVETVTTGTIPASGGGNVDIAATAGWPDGSTGPFSIVVDPGQANEEKILVSTLGGSTLTYTSGNRGWDSTASSAHAAGAVVYLVAGALDFDEANAHHNATANAHNATAVAFSPGGTVAATTVQAAIAEVAVDYATADTAITTAYQAADTTLAARATAIEANGWVVASRIAHTTLRRAAAQSIPNNTATAIVFDTADSNPDGIWSSGANVTMTASGMYAISFVITFASGNPFAGAWHADFAYTGLGGSSLTPVATIAVATSNAALKTMFSGGVSWIDTTQPCVLEVLQTSGGALNCTAELRIVRLA